MQFEAPLRELIADQEGAVTRAQLIAAGLTRSQAWQMVRSGRWQSLHDGVYATFTGPPGDRTLVWAAILAVGQPGAASHRTALWLAGLLTEPPGVIRLSVPIERNRQAPSGARVTRRRDFDRVVRASASPPRIRLEPSILDVVGEAAAADVVLGLVFAATQRRFTTPARLRAELAARHRRPWRKLLCDLLTDVEAGVDSDLERRYLRDVERPHGLPTGTRNKPEKYAGSNQYKDVRYRRFNTVVELDGRGAHPDDQRFRDWRRDNAAVVADEDTLRSGWHDVVGVPCEVARQVAVVLSRNGWPGTVVRCPRCPTDERGGSAAPSAADPPH